MIFHVITIVEYCNMTFHWHCSSCLWIVWLEYHIADCVRVEINTT